MRRNLPLRRNRPSLAYWHRPRGRYANDMSLRCLFGAHRPSLVSIIRGKNGGWVGLCRGCDAHIERTDEGRWFLSEPLISKKD